MANEGLTSEMRGIVEYNIDAVVENIPTAVFLMSHTDIEPSEETVTAWTLGTVMTIVEMAYHRKDQELTEKQMEEISEIVARRKPEIVRAYREHTT